MAMAAWDESREEGKRKIRAREHGWKTDEREEKRETRSSKRRTPVGEAMLFIRGVPQLACLLPVEAVLGEVIHAKAAAL